MTTKGDEMSAIDYVYGNSALPDLYARYVDVKAFCRSVEILQESSIIEVTGMDTDSIATIGWK